MGSYVPLMQVVIKFDPYDKGTLCGQFCCVFQSTSDIAEKLIGG